MASAVYVAALLLNAIAGMPMPPIRATRIIASLSVFAGAPALVWFVMMIAMRRSAQHPVAARVVVAAISVFAATAILNRVVQLAIVTQSVSGIGTQLDLYVTATPANFVEMFAWDFCLGVVAISASRLLTEPAETWPRRTFALAGLLLLIGELLYLVSVLQLGGLPIALAGMGFSVAAWVLGLPAATLWTGIAAREESHVTVAEKRPSPA
jgi:hypothetical protein